MSYTSGAAYELHVVEEEEREGEDQKGAAGKAASDDVLKALLLRWEIIGGFRDDRDDKLCIGSLVCIWHECI